MSATYRTLEGINYPHMLLVSKLTVTTWERDLHWQPKRKTLAKSIKPPSVHSICCPIVERVCTTGVLFQLLAIFKYTCTTAIGW